MDLCVCATGVDNRRSEGLKDAGFGLISGFYSCTGCQGLSRLRLFPPGRHANSTLRTNVHGRSVLDVTFPVSVNYHISMAIWLHSMLMCAEEEEEDGGMRGRHGTIHCGVHTTGYIHVRAE